MTYLGLLRLLGVLGQLRVQAFAFDLAGHDRCVVGLSAAREKETEKKREKTQTEREKVVENRL